MERDDGFADPGSLMQYFTEYPDWGPLEQRMPDFVHGNILDVGCGAGRHALHLQNLGFEVVGIDKSPLAIEVAKQRGLRQAYRHFARRTRAEQHPLSHAHAAVRFHHHDGPQYRTSPRIERRKKDLRAFHRITTPDARIIGTTRDPHDTTDPDHLAYQARNRRQGRMSGQIRFRIRHRKLASDWMYYLFLSEEEFRELVHGTGWRLEDRKGRLWIRQRRLELAAAVGDHANNSRKLRKLELMDNRSHPGDAYHLLFLEGLRCWSGLASICWLGNYEIP